MSKSQEKQVLLEALRKQYTLRSPIQHRVVCQAIAQNFPTLSSTKIKSLSFYIQVKQGPLSISSLEYPKNSFVIKFNQLNPQMTKSSQIIGSKDIYLNEEQFASVLSYQKYINIQLLGETSIENQLSFWQSSQYFCSISRKKIIQAMKSAQVLKFSQNQVVFYEGQQITKTQSGSGIYIVRKGQFGYFKSTSKKQIETFRFESGHIFGALQIMQEQKMRSMSARCKTQTSIVYHFSQDDFNRLFLKYCSAIIYSKQNKLLKHLQNKVVQMKNSLSLSDNFGKTSSMLNKNITKRSFFGQTSHSVKIQEQAERKAFPFIRTEQIKKSAGTTFFKSLKQSQRIQNQSLKRTNFWSLKKEGPLKIYPMISHRSNFISSQFKGLQKLFLSKRDSVLNTQKQQIIKQNGSWKRDVIFSIYRQSFYKRRENESKISGGIQ